MARITIFPEKKSNMNKNMKNKLSQHKMAAKPSKNKSGKAPLEVDFSNKSGDQFMINSRKTGKQVILDKNKMENKLSEFGKSDGKIKEKANKPCSDKVHEHLPTHKKKRKFSDTEIQAEEPCLPTKKSKGEASTSEGYGLFVHNIPDTAKKCEVKEVFKSYGDISHIILPLKRPAKGTARSNFKNKGFAIVKFCSKKSLSAALSQTKHQIDGKLVQVRAERKTKFQEATAPNKAALNTSVSHVVYVGNIKKGTPCEELEEHFSQFGDVSNVIVCPAHAKLKKPYAQVVFSSAEAKAAVLSTSKHMLGSVALSVGSTKADVLGADAVDNLRAEHEIFVAKLSEDTSVETLRKHFSKYGSVTRVFQPRCPNTNKAKRCAFVAFESERSVQAALEEDHEIDMQTLLVRDSKVDVGKKVKAGSQQGAAWDHALFVARVPLDAGKEALASHFSKYGEVADVRLAWDSVTKRTKSYGLVFFSDAQGLQAALAEKHKISGTEIFVKKNERKKEDRAEQDPAKLRDVVADGHEKHDSAISGASVGAHDAHSHDEDGSNDDDCDDGDSDDDNNEGSHEESYSAGQSSDEASDGE